jgi:hypothetical protein
VDKTEGKWSSNWSSLILTKSNVPVSVDPSKKWVFPTWRFVGEVCHQTDIGRSVGAGHIPKRFWDGRRVDGQVAVQVDRDAQVEQRPTYNGEPKIIFKLKRYKRIPCHFVDWQYLKN